MRITELQQSQYHNSLFTIGRECRASIEMTITELQQSQYHNNSMFTIGRAC